MKERMKTILRRGWRPIAGLAGLAVILFWAAGGCRPRVAPGTVAYAPGLAVPEGAATLTVTAEDVPTRVDVIGTVASEERINLSARIPGYVKEVFVSAGDQVKAGQKLITQDDREIREQLAAAEAGLNQAQSEYQRTKELLKTQATTEQAFTAAESAYNGARAQVERVKVMLTYAQITSPIDGLVTDRRIEVGDLANPGQLLLAVYAPDRMRLEAPVPVRLVGFLALGQKLTLNLERPAGTYQGTVTEIVSEVDPLSRTQKVKVHIDAPGAAILPGTFGRLWVDAARHPAVLVPAGAIYRVGQLQLVQVVQDGRALRRLVTTGATYGDRVEVLSGLEPGDKILTAPIKEG